MSYLATPKQLSSWLKDTATQLGQYRVKVDRLLMLNRLWKQQTHIPLSLHSTIANCDDNTLVLAVETSGWASELHYTQRSLCQLFSSWPNLSIKKIKCYVKAAEPKESKPLKAVSPKATGLSKANKALLRSVASTLPHTELMQALFKLAK